LKEFHIMHTVPPSVWPHVAGGKSARAIGPGIALLNTIRLRVFMLGRSH
jgi:hypothetical protein